MCWFAFQVLGFRVRFQGSEFTGAVLLSSLPTQSLQKPHRIHGVRTDYFFAGKNLLVGRVRGPVIKCHGRP